MTSRLRETLLIRLPPESGLAHLARLVAVHFFRQSGLSRGSSRAAAARVERGWRSLVGRRRGAPAPVGAASISLLFVSGVDAIEVFGRLPGGARRLLSRCTRPVNP